MRYEYLALEAVSNVKHEYVYGHIFAMAGGTPEHAALQAGLAGLFGQLSAPAPCRVHSSDLRVRVLASGLATDPDLTVVCGRSEREPADANGVTNPTLIVEVTSRSSAEYDRGEKLEHYKQIPSLAQIVLVAHDARAVEVWTRRAETWNHQVYGDGDTAELSAVGARGRA